jgi:probable F420-dependent oxidoreductase
VSTRYGITVPFDGISLLDHREVITEIADLGYSDLWSMEVDGADAFSILAFAAAIEPRLRLGTAIVPVYTRGPALLAQSAAALADLAPGRFTLGIGASSPVIVERWNAIAYDKPYQRSRDTLAFLKRALTGEKIDEEYETFSIRGFKLSRSPSTPPPIHLAALRAGMLRLAGREADGVILNWLSAGDVTTVLAESGRTIDVTARVFVIPNDNATEARAIGRRMVAAYLNVAGYAAFQAWLGRGPQLEAMWEAWASGDRKHALEAIPDEVVDDLIIHGNYEQCRQHIQAYVDNGVTIPILAITATGEHLREAIRELSPAHHAPANS